jgi:hypothetical protein
MYFLSSHLFARHHFVSAVEELRILQKKNHGINSLYSGAPALSL